MAIPGAAQKDFTTKVHQHIWVITSTDTAGAGVKIPGAADRTVQFLGTWGGATIQLEGSLKETPDETTGTDWFPLTDPQGNAISKSADGGEAVIENVLWVRPRATTAGSGASVTVYLLSRSA